MKLLLLFMAICWGGTAFATTCEPGYYVDNSECKECPHRAFYCPGDDVRYECPADTTDWAARFNEMGWVLTADIPKSILMSWDNNSASETYGGPAKKIRDCFADMDISTTKGRLEIQNPYNGVDYWGNNILWYVANDGYYLSGHKFSRLYSDAKACTNAPANAHYTGPGTPDAPDGSVTDANDCPWACDAGYGKSASGECLPLCSVGITKIRANSVSVPLFNEKHTSPAIAVEYAGHICYSDLVLGTGRPAINIDYHGQVYHTVNE